MKSFCIKNNNNIILNYLLVEFENMNMKDIYISKNEFKYYKNVIIHYKGENTNKFVFKISNILANCILKFYENIIMKKLIKVDYFYFEPNEKEIILRNCIEALNDENTKDFNFRKEKIYKCLVDYINENKYFILDGFVNFRLYEYRNMLGEVLDMAVNKFIIDKEYKEFIKLLREFISCQPNRTGIIHIIYSKFEPIILDEGENIIPYERNISNRKYLSDISFSANDYCLNELLNLLPKKVILHLVCEEDEFTNTLQLIFQGRIIVCKECNICKTFSFVTENGN